MWGRLVHSGGFCGKWTSDVTARLSSGDGALRYRENAPDVPAFNAAIREIEGSQMDEAFEHLRKLSGAPDPIRF